MRICPECGGNMVLWGHGRMERWRCPACHRIRRKDYHTKVEITPGAPQQDSPNNNVFVETDDVTLYHGDCLDILRTLPDESVDCCITSPPYFGLRDYGADGQLGLEETPEQYVGNMVKVFREVRRVMADHATLWLNLGDSYASQGGPEPAQTKWQVDGASNTQNAGRSRTPGSLKPKDLIGIPWMVAFALRADGWYLRSDIIWAKPNPMPESVTDRPTKSHEYIFLLSKNSSYYFDQEAVREPHESTRWGGPVITQPPTTKYAEATAEGSAGAAEALSAPGREWNAYPEGGRNIRSVWNIATAPYPGAHFATFPENLVRRCLLAGCPIRVCEMCGKPSERIVTRDRKNVEGWAPVKKLDHSQNAADQGHGRFGDPITETVGWTNCGHNNWRPGRVLDPFVGSGTVPKVARDHRMHAIGIDLNIQYLELAARRVLKQSKITLSDDLKPAPDGTLNLFAQD